LTDVVSRALAEDLGDGDATSLATVDEDARARATIAQKAPGVLFGFDAAEEAFRQLDPDVEITRIAAEGEWREGGPVLLLEGRTRALLGAERTALNFLQRLSGVATATARAVQEVEGTGTQILDTRKTTPGLRALEKAAVRAGGGVNHRANLSEAVLVKDNHLGGLSVTAAVEAARRQWPGRHVEVECDSFDQLKEALAAGADMVMLDNMDAAQAAEAVSLVRGHGTTPVEVSGRITLESAAAYARAGVDFVSVCAVTHSAPVLDIGLDLGTS
jgi:nicotinate-nucleotide pyrophosphorylase (carboxylating)